MSKLCTCWHKCKGGKEIHPSTYTHHAKWRPSPLFVAYLEKEKVKYDSGTYGCPLMKVDASVGKIYRRFQEAKKRENETEEERKIRYREVKRIASHRWYERHKKRMSEYSKRWRENNKDRIKAKLEKKKKEEKEKAKKKDGRGGEKERKKKERTSRLEKGKKRERDDSDAEDNELEDEKLWGTMADNDEEFVPPKRRKLRHEDEDSDKENATSSVTGREVGSDKKMRVSARKMAATKRIVPESSSSLLRLEMRQINSRATVPMSAPAQSILITSLKTGNVSSPDDLLKKERHIRWADTSTRKSSPPGTTQRSLLLSRSCGPAPDEENAKPHEIKPKNDDEVSESDDENKLERKKMMMENSDKAEDMVTNLDEISSLSSFNSEDDMPSYTVIESISDSSVSIEDDTEAVV